MAFMFGLAHILSARHSEAGLLGQVKTGEMQSLKNLLKTSFFRSYTEISDPRTYWSHILE